MTVRVTFSRMRLARTLLLTAAIGCLGAYGCSFLYQKVYQIYAGWQFDEVEAPAEPGADSSSSSSIAPALTLRASPARLSGTVGRISIPRLHLSAIVDEGVDDGTLLRAVGHIPGTPLPGARGNVGIAGHRDSFFRRLKDIQPDDEIDFVTARGSFKYVVKELAVVDPENVAVLRATGEPTLTMVTCYPFRYIGNAPRRFIVSARQVAPLSAGLRRESIPGK